MSDLAVQNSLHPSYNAESRSCIWQGLSLARTYIVQPVIWVGSQLYHLVKAIVRVFYETIQIIYYMRLISHRGLRHPELVEPSLLDTAAYFAYARAVLSPPQPLDLRTFGLEQSINPQHFAHTPPAAVPVGQPPATDLRQLLTYFDTWIHEGDEDLDLSDSDTPIKDVAELRQGLEKYITLNIGSRFPCSARVVTFGKHLVHFLSLDKFDPVQKRQCLIDLARGGHRECPTRMFESSELYFRIWSGNFHFQTLPDAVYASLHDLRFSILNEMAGESGEELVHAIGELLLTVGTRVGIRDAAIGGYNDHLDLIYKFAPEFSLPIFFSRYTREVIIPHLLHALNGDPGKEDVCLRRNISINRELLTDWFQQNYHGDQDMIEFMLDAATNTVKRQAVEYFLSRMPVLHL